MTKAIRAAGLGAALLAMAAPAAAAIPINIQQRGHLRQIIDLPALANFFPISRIELIGPDTWRLTAGRCHVDVRMVPVPSHAPGLVGPRYAPRPGRRVCQR